MKPEGVRVVRPDGTEINCELIHDGVDDEGIDMWVVAGVVFDPGGGDQLRIGMLPARTAIEIRGAGSPPDFVSWDQ